MFNGMHDGLLWGMHWGGWLLWILLIMGVVWVLTRAQSGRQSHQSQQRETPLDVLQRRYAEGELSTEEYEERKERLQRDQ